MIRIVFLDSGIGGIPYYVKAIKEIPDIFGYYFADTAFFPYGKKATWELQDRLLILLARIEKTLHPDIIVLACNTASVSSLAQLRRASSVPIIGTVPAVKPASEISEGNLGILATKQTIADSYLSELIQKYASDKHITLFPADTLIQVIEENFFSLIEGQSDNSVDATESINSVVQECIRAECDTVVLGCTHFTHIAEHFDRIAEHRIRLVDSREGILRQIHRCIESLPEKSSSEPLDTREDKDTLCKNHRNRSIFVCTSSDRQEYYKRICEHFSIGFAGLLQGLG